ncbi:MAG TPA: hypothetical protein VKT77_14245 [Chthonomonadaceae bacterium]|nr:hypothetical protein [Chthonomonadaceae bacterium]
MWQQWAVYLCVAAAGIYLARYIYTSLRAVLEARKGCGDGCAKCAFAQQPKPARPSGTPPGGIIALTDIRATPPRKP